jgi:hypothetical protein
MVAGHNKPCAEFQSPLRVSLDISFDFLESHDSTDQQTDYCQLDERNFVADQVLEIFDQRSAQAAERRLYGQSLYGRKWNPSMGEKHTSLPQRSCAAIRGGPHDHTPNRAPRPD